MAREEYTATEAAQRLGISLDTLRGWDRAGRIKLARLAEPEKSRVAASEIDRLRAEERSHGITTRNHGTITAVKVDGLMAQVELVVTEPHTSSHSSRAMRSKSSVSSPE